jgi:hypothetical protein
MSNSGSYNTFVPLDHLQNDRKQARITFIGMAFAAVIVVLLIIAMVK